MTEAEIPRLRMQAIRKSFGQARVLDDVAFYAKPGEIVALLGSNGAGKSTLMKILTGVYTRDSGDIEVNGTPVEMASPRDALRLGITFLPQEISVFPELSVAENVCLSGQGGGRVDWAGMAVRAGRVLDELGFGHIRPDMRVGDLGVAEQRIVEIARALEGEADILVMDEPTAALSEQESEQIFEILHRLKARGTAVVYISHYLNEVFRIADRIVVLRDGRNAGEFSPTATDVAEVVAAMLGQAAGHLFEDRPPLPPDAAVLFSARGLQLPGRIADVSFDLRKGEILGIFGLIGSGVEVLGRMIFGVEGRLPGGAMTLAGAPYAPASPRAARDAGVGFVTAERKTDGILADLSVAQNLVAPFQGDFGRGAFLAPERERAHAADWIARIGIRTSGPDQPIRLLSGGNQQKVCVARWLNPKVRMLILEEPTRGVDVGARRELYGHLAAFAGEGLAILVLSSDVEEVAGLSDRSLVIDRGRITAEFARGATAADLMGSVAGDHATPMETEQVSP
jgi:ribose transport system ATP-binding protein